MVGGKDEAPRRVVADLPTLLASPAELGHLTIGATLAGRFVVEERLGRGGGGTVYAARDKLLGERVALKLLTRGVDEDILARVRAEVRAARRIGHPNVCRVHELHVEGDALFLAMELLEGVTLRQRLARSVPLGEAIELARQLGAGLAAAHRAGVVHCDVKPENAILVDDRVVVTDFGIARSLDTKPATSTGFVEGTPTYMAPEQCRGEAVTPRTDVYALAAVVYEIFVGRPPFGRMDAGSLSTYVKRVIGEPVVVPPDVPVDAAPAARAALAAVLARGLAKAAGDRPDGVEAFVTALIAAAGVVPRSIAIGPSRGGARVEGTPTPLPTPIPTPIPTPGGSTTGRARGTRRLVTIVHVLCDPAHWEARTALPGEGQSPLIDDEEAAERLDSLMDAARATLSDAGGAIVGASPGSLVAAFGARSAAGDEAERAAQAARGLAIADPAARVRVGIDTGRLLVRGGTGAATPSVAGEALARAAKLAADAEPGEVRASSRTARHLQRRFALQRTADDAAIVGARSNRAAITERALLVGREDALRQITGALAEGGTRAVLVLGAPGIGKSRVVAELVDRVRGAARLTVVEAVGTPERALVSYGIARALLGALTGLPERPAPDEALEAARRVLGATGSTGEGGTLAAALAGLLAERQEAGTPVAAAIRAALHASAADTPRLLVVDDAHWADDASLELLEALARGEAGPGLTVLLAARPELRERRPRLAASVGTVVELAPLDEASALALATRHLSGDAVAAAQLAAIAEGNPFFIEELARDRLEGGGSGASTTVEDAIQARLDRLDPEVRDVLRAAAVLGRVFRRADLVELLGAASGVDDALAALEARGLAQPLPPDASDDDRWELRHALVRDVAYGELPAAERRRLHDAAGAAVRAHLEAAGHHAALADLVALARHAEGADRGEQAVEAWRRAGEAAARDASFADAHGAFTRACALTPRPTPSLLGAAGEAALQVGELARAEALLDDAIRLAEAEGPFAVARALLQRAAVARQRARWDEGVTLLRRGLAILPDETTDVVLAARLHAALGWILGYILGDPAGLPATEHAVALLEPTGHRAELAGALKSLGATYMRAGRFSDQLACNRKNLAIGEELGSLPLRAVAHLNLGVNLIDLGEIAEAAEHSTHARDLFTRMCAAPTVALAKNNLGLARLLERKLDDAETLVGEALEAARTMGGAYVCEAELTSARIAAARGDLALAAQRAEAAVARADGEGGKVDRGIARRVLGAIRSRAGAHDAATNLLDAAWELLDGADLAEAARVTAERARAAQRRGAPAAEVDAAYTTAAAALERLGARFDLERLRDTSWT